MRQAQLLAPQRQAVPVTAKIHSGIITTDRPNRMWVIDATARSPSSPPLTIAQPSVWAFMPSSVPRASRLSNPSAKVSRQHFGGFRVGAAEGLRLRHDHGSQFMSDDFQNELTFLGIESSPAFVREPEGNGCIERFFRTLKEQLLWVRHFQSIPELVRGLEEFPALYNQHWLIERLGFEPPVRARQRLALQPAA